MVVRHVMPMYTARYTARQERDTLAASQTGRCDHNRRPHKALLWLDGLRPLHDAFGRQGAERGVRPLPTPPERLCDPA